MSQDSLKFSPERTKKRTNKDVFALLTLIPAVFIIIVAVLINIGGVKTSGEGGTNIKQQENKPFYLTSWDFHLSSAVEPTIVNAYTYTLYLNRFCRKVSNIHITDNTVTVLTDWCLNTGTLKTLTDYSLPAVNYAAYQRLFHFSKIDMDPPVAFLIIAAITAFGGLVTGFGTLTSKTGTTKRVGLLLSVITFISMIISASILTYYSTRLRSEINNNTTTGELTSTQYGRQVTYNMTLDATRIGGTALGLLWAGVVASILQMALWALAYLRGSKVRGVPDLDKDEAGGEFRSGGVEA